MQTELVRVHTHSLHCRQAAHFGHVHLTVHGSVRSVQNDLQAGTVVVVVVVAITILSDESKTVLMHAWFGVYYVGAIMPTH